MFQMLQLLNIKIREKIFDTLHNIKKSDNFYFRKNIKNNHYFKNQEVQGLH